MAIVVMVLLSVLGAALLALSTTEVQIAAGYRDGVAAQYLAEAGVQAAMVKLASDPVFLNSTAVQARSVANSSPKNIGMATEGHYEVTVGPVSNNANQRIIKSTGVIDKGIFKAKRLLVVNVSLPSQSIYDYASYSAGEMTIASNTIINGDIGSNSAITQYGGTINGNIVSCSVYKSFGGIVGTVTQTSKNYIIPVAQPEFSISFDPNNYVTGQVLPNPINGNVTVAGRYYVNGDLVLNDAAKIEVSAGSSLILFVDGSVQLHSGSAIQGDVRIIASGSVDINGGKISAPATGGIGVYANEAIYIRNSAVLDTDSGEITILSKNNAVEIDNGTIRSANTGKTGIYSNTYIICKSNSTITNNAVIMANGEVIMADGAYFRTVVISGKNADINFGSKVLAAYSAGQIHCNGGEINYNADVVRNLGLSSNIPSLPILINTWNNK